MLKCLPAIFFFLLLSACKDKNKSVNEGNDGPVAASDFLDEFSPLKLPFTVYDTAINSIGGTDTIGYNAFTRFAPDTVLGKEKKISIHPVGKYNNKNKEFYLLALVKSKNASKVLLLVFDKNQKFSASLPLVASNTGKETFSSATIDNRLTISINKEWKNKDEQLYNRTIYAYNNVGMFTLVMTETNDQSGKSNIINNSLDTLPSRNKYSGDYIKGKNNMVSIRDGKTPASYLFFVHFENEGEEQCIGELKGELTMKTPTSGVYSENSDPCVVDFTFTNNKVTVKEQGSCGSYRGIKCFFNHTYTRKKEVKLEKKKST